MAVQRKDQHQLLLHPFQGQKLGKVKNGQWWGTTSIPALLPAAVDVAGVGSRDQNLRNIKVQHGNSGVSMADFILTAYPVKDRTSCQCRHTTKCLYGIQKVTQKKGRGGKSDQAGCNCFLIHLLEVSKFTVIP